DEWTRFYIPFVTRPGRSVDPEKLAKGGYKLGMVFSSSIHGDTFEGAEGSTLYIDEVEVICAED
ncbi:MAG: PCMD domain-containing protein, partial [Parabacteroides sp.]|nr:PCMD domain-containing protein [Parabacteroides sp.]